MSEKEPIYTIYGSSSRFSQATREREVERVKSEALEAFASMGIRFPVNSRQELLDAIPGDMPTACHYGGRSIPLKELAGSLRDEDFPLKSAAEAADTLAESCPAMSESPEGAPDTKPL